jgi:hypothetical protein
MMGLPVKPGWLEPSTVTGSEIVGKAVKGVIVWNPEPGMLKMIMSAPGWVLASRIACLSEPAPLSPALVTTKMDAGSVIATASGLESASGATGAKMKPNTNGTNSNTAALLVVLLIGEWMREAFISMWEILRVSVFGVAFRNAKDGSQSKMKAPEAPEKRIRVTTLLLSQL